MDSCLKPWRKLVGGVDYWSLFCVLTGRHNGKLRVCSWFASLWVRRGPNQLFSLGLRQAFWLKAPWIAAWPYFLFWSFLHVDFPSICWNLDIPVNKFVKHLNLYALMRYLAQDFRGTLLRQQRHVEVDTLVNSGGSMRDRRALLWKQQIDRWRLTLVWLVVYETIRNILINLRITGEGS